METEIVDYKGDNFYNPMSDLYGMRNLHAHSQPVSAILGRYRVQSDSSSADSSQSETSQSELEERISELEERISELSKENMALHTRIDKLESMFQAVISGDPTRPPFSRESKKATKIRPDPEAKKSG